MSLNSRQGFAFECSSNARKPTAQYTDSCTQGKAGARHSREAFSLPHDYPSLLPQTARAYVPKGKVWDGASGHWVEAEGEEGEEGGDAKRAKKE